MEKKKKKNRNSIHQVAYQLREGATSISNHVTVIREFYSNRARNGWKIGRKYPLETQFFGCGNAEIVGIFPTVTQLQ